MKYTSYRSINNKYKDKTTELYKSLDVFWAFSNEQFKKGAGDCKKITKLVMGGYIPSKNFKEYKKKDDELFNWYVSEVKKLDPVEVIKYELSNHEAYYSFDITDAFRVLRAFYTREQVMQVFNDNKHIASSW